MSCIFSCFRVKHDSPSTVKKSSPEDVTVNRNRSPLSSFFIPEENVCVASKGNGSEVHALDFEELNNQAKFLEPCGTIPESETPNGSHKGTVESLKFKSWLTNTSVEKLDSESQQDQLPYFNKDSKAWLDGDDSQEHTPSSCMTFEHNSERRNSLNSNMAQNAVSAEVLSVLDHNTLESSVSSNTTTPSIPLENKSIRFDLHQNTHSASCERYPSESPTPQTLNLSRRKVLDDVASPFRNQVDPLKKGDEFGELETLKTSIGSMESSNLDGSKSNVVKNLHHVKILGDKPIIGLVATHWNDNEASRVSPKWWDGNGIPNSTNKYREDQKVSWIATSFEERLEKALSEESLISQWKQRSGTPPVNSIESEESDTAMSQQQLHPSSTYFKSVVSF